MPDRTPQKKIDETETQESFAEPESLELVEVQATATTNPKIAEANTLIVQPQSKVAHTAGELEILPPETVIDAKYRISSCIGKGSTSAVYKVQHITLNQQFALKLFAAGSNFSSEYRCQAEVRAAEKFDHPNIAKTVEVGLLDGKQLFYVMEFIEGETLAQYLKRCGRLTYDDIFSVFIPLCWALQDAQEKGIVHGGVNPGNIMLTGQQGSLQCKLLDFGNAKFLDGDRPAEFDSADLEEDPIYMSPELLTGKKADHRSDIYSLGCTLYEAITARPPFSAETRDSIRSLHLNAAPPTLREASLGRDFPDELERIVQTMLAKDPQQRFSTAGHVCESLMRLKLNEQLRIKPKTPEKVKSTREETAIITLGATTAIAAGLAMYFWLQSVQSISSSRRRVETFAISPIYEKRTNIQLEDFSADPIRRTKPLTPDKLHTLDKPDTSATPFLKKRQIESGNEIRNFEFPTNIGTLETPSKSKYQADGQVVIAWQGPLVFYPNSYALSMVPNLFKRFETDEVRAIVFENTQALKLKYIQDFSRYTLLNELSFDNSRIGDAELKFLEKLPHLTSLGLLSTDVSAGSLAKFSRLKSLKKLTLGEIPKVGVVLKALQGSTSLEDLKLRNCQNLEPIDYQLIGTLPRLRKLAIEQGTEIDPALFDGLAKSKSLRELDLTGSIITEPVIEGLHKLHNLRILDISSREIPMELRAKLKFLTPYCERRFH